MKRLLIVDDEHHIVNWLAELMSPLADMNIEIMKAYSGMEMLELLKTYRVDVILLDIQMPNMTGLEAAKKVLNDWPTTRIIFLTAYDLFDYLYQSNALPNTTYLLKTEPDDVIMSTVKNAFQQLHDHEISQKLLDEAAETKILLQHLKQQDFLRTLVHDTFSFTSSFKINQQSKHLTSLDFSRDIYLLYTRIFSSSISFSQNTYASSCIAFINNVLCDKFSFCMLETSSDSFLWFFQDNREHTGTSAVSSVNFLRNVADDFANASETLVNGFLYNVLLTSPVSLNQIAHSFHLLQQYAISETHQNVCYISSSSCISFETLHSFSEVTTPSDNVLSSSVVEELSGHLFRKDQSAYMELLSSIAQKYSRIKSMHNLSAIQVYSSIALTLIQYISQHNLEKQLSQKVAIYPLYYIQDFKTWNKAFQYLTQVSIQLFSLISSAENNRNEYLISLVEKYIKNNLNKPLSISEVASRMNYNATYISRLYRQIRGITLSEYITQCRVRAATHLLLTTDAPIQNIARETGFDTAQYFSIVFKKETGKSPREFRTLHLKS